MLQPQQQLLCLAQQICRVADSCEVSGRVKGERVSQTDRVTVLSEGFAKQGGRQVGEGRDLKDVCLLFANRVLSRILMMLLLLEKGMCF